MPKIMSLVASALKADQSQLERASLNAANAATPGYKRSSLVALNFDRAMSAHEAVSASESDWAPMMPVLKTITDFSAGGLQQTGRALDLTVEGRGFFKLTDGSRTWLTRTAALHVDSNGDLVGPKGLQLVGSQGVLKPGSATDLSITAVGDVMRGDQVLGRIALVNCLDDTQMRSDDGVLFESPADQLEDVDADKGVFRSGFLEASNTSNLKEMLSVMEGVRHFESLIRLAQGYDEVVGKAIQKLGEV